MKINANEFRKIDLNLLVVFHYLMKYRSVTKAADELALSVSAVSMSLNRLRDLLQDDLLVRANIGMIATPLAEKIVSEVDQILASVHNLVYQKPLLELATLVKTFRLGVSESIEYAYLPELFGEFHRLAPHAKLIVRDMETGKALNMLDSGEIDLAIGVFSDIPDRFHQQEIFSENYICVFSSDHIAPKNSLLLDDYLYYNHIILSYSGVARNYIDEQLEKIGQARNVIATNTRLGAMYLWLKQAPLICTMPERLGKKCAMLHDLTTSPLPLDIPSCTTKMVWHSRTHQDDASNWLKNLVLKYIV